MNIAELKERISPIPSEDLDTAVRSADAVRGWLQCVNASQPVCVVDSSVGVDLASGINRANSMADEGTRTVIVDLESPISDLGRAAVGLLCSVDATRVTPSAESDFEWMQHCIRIRDLQAAHRSHISDVLDIVDGELAATVGLLLGLAARRTPVVLVGPYAHAAAVIAQRQSLAAANWWRSGLADADPVVTIANERLHYEPWWSGGTPVSPEVVHGLLVGTIEQPAS